MIFLLEAEPDCVADVIALGLFRHVDFDRMEPVDRRRRRRGKRRKRPHGRRMERFLLGVRPARVVGAVDAPAVGRALESVLVALAVFLGALGFLAPTTPQHDRTRFLNPKKNTNHVNL